MCGIMSCDSYVATDKCLLKPRYLTVPCLWGYQFLGVFLEEIFHVVEICIWMTHVLYYQPKAKTDF